MLKFCICVCVCVCLCVCVCVYVCAGGVACSLRRTIAHAGIAYLNFCMSFVHVSLKESLY